MDNRPVGIFDSGLGGLTAVRALRALLPNEDIIYFADSGRVPYGARPAAQLRRMAVQDMDFAASRGVKAIIAACGTVSSNAPDLLDAYPVPVFGVLKTSVRAISLLAGDAPLGIIATEASIKSGSFAGALSPLCPGREIISIACPDFVPLIESGHSAADDEQVQAAVERYLRPMKEAGIGALLLGCTHYGIIEGAISAFLGRGTQLVSASDCAARAMCDYLLQNGLTGGRGQEEFYTSGSVQEFCRMAGLFLGRSLGSTAKQVPVMEA